MRMRVKILGAAMAVGSTFRLGPVTSVQSDSDKDERLVGVHIFFRHGARTPIYNIPYNRDVVSEASWDKSMTTDVEHTFMPYTVCDVDGKPHKEDLSAIPMNQRLMLGGALSGQLTRLGQQEMFDYGRRLRQRYVDEHGLISPTYDPQQVYCRSTRLTRNLRSMRCLLAGMFDWTAGNEEPVKLHVSHPKTEILWPNRRLCAWVHARIYNLKPVNYPKGMFDLREKVARILGPKTLETQRELSDGSKETIPAWMYSVRDELYVRKYHGVTLSKTALGLLEEMNAVCGHEMVAAIVGVGENWRSVGLRAATGPLCRQISENITEMTSGNSKCQKLLLYATHDAMIVPLLLVFNIFDGQWPNFGADLRIEVFETKKRGHIVKLFYCDKCCATMSLSDFRRLLEEIATDADSYREVCDYEKKAKLR